MDVPAGRKAVGFVPDAARPDLEAFWPGRRLDAFDGLCRRVAPSRVPG